MKDSNSIQEWYDDVEKASTGQSFLRKVIFNGGTNFSGPHTDNGSGASMDLSVFQPIVPAGYYYLGQVAVQGYPASCPLSCVIVQPINDDPNHPCLKSVSGFANVWCDKGSHKRSDYSFWQPTCTDPNYVAVGTIFVSGEGTNEQTPNPSDYPNLMLVRSDLVTQVKCDTYVIWDDAGSGASANASLFFLPTSNYFICSTGPEGVPPPGQYPDLHPLPAATPKQN